MISKLFLLLCTALTVFLSLSGLLSIHSLLDLITQLVFLPIPLYLLGDSLMQLANWQREPEVSLARHKFSLLVIAVLFAALWIYKFIINQ